MKKGSSPAIDISVIFLLAGESKRMPGIPKLLLPFGGTTVLEHTLATLTGFGFREFIAVAGSYRESMEPVLKKFAVKIVFNPGYREGMAASIRIGIAAASRQSQGYMICPADLPLLESGVLQRLVEVFMENPQESIVYPTVAGQPRSLAIFSRKFRTDLLKLRGDRGAREIIETYRTSAVPVEFEDETPFMDLDTPLDYHRILHLQRR